MKKSMNWILLSVSFCYLECVFKGIEGYAINIWCFIYGTGLAAIIALFISGFKEKIQSYLFYVLLALVTLFFMMQVCVKDMFNFYFDFGLLTTADQVGAFWKDILKLLARNMGNIALMMVPFIVLVYLNKYLSFKKEKTINIIISLVLILVYMVSFKAEDITTEQDIIDKGIIATFFDSFKAKKETEMVTEVVVEETVEEPDEEIKPYYHVLDIDFDRASSNDATINKLNEYFAESSGTLSNEMTGYFEDKNLVLILGESFNEIGVFEDLCPTLYKMIHEGFNFSNYYSTSYNSTLGGEFQLLNGMYAISDALGIWKSGTYVNPLGIANVFKDNGYTTHAYHDNTYDYMDRNSYLASVGFDNYMGCGNGLESRMNCHVWTESDEEMMASTVSDYASEDKFFTYYVTVSAHGPYTYDTNSNEMGVKYKEFIESQGYAYSETVMCYLSAMVELDHAMESLMSELDDAGKLDDTVFILAGDHYPYYLNESCLTELCGHEVEETVDVCKNSLIIYNTDKESVTCDKTGNTMDVLPTIYNLFGIDYDSRIIPGTDLFSESSGFAIFGNGSWVSDYGTYYADKGSFVAKEGIEIPEGYFDSANAYVNSKRALTYMIFSTKYYDFINKYIKK